MKNVFKKFIGSILICALLLGSVIIPDVTSKAATATLLNTYGALFGNSGMCVDLAELQNSTKLSHIKTHYNSITLENEMKPDALLGYSPSLISQDTAKSLGYYVPSSCTESYLPKINFNTIDAVLKICYENGIKVRAHTLVWHSQTPDWFFRTGYSTNYGYVSQSQMDIRMEYYIKTVMNHVYTSSYGSVVYAWDVVNEYLHASNSGWQYIYGSVTTSPAFVKKAFQYAYDCINYFGLTDSVSLFYNDYNTYMEVNDIITMIKYINSSGKICNGVGMQSHLGTTFPSVDYYTAALQSFVNAGLEVQITELDVCNSGDVDQANYMYDLMTKILSIKKNGGNITGITYWGLSDDVTWIANEKPLLFSTFGNAKYAYYRVLDAYTDAGFQIGGSSSSSSSSGSSGSTTTTGSNLVTNGDIENGTSSWEGLYGCTLGLGYYTVNSGSLSLKVSDRTMTPQGAMQYISGLERGATYKVSAAVRYNKSENSSATGNTKFYMSIIYGDGTIENMASVTTASDTWAVMDGEYTVPGNADLSSVRVFIETAYTSNPTAQDLVTFFVDDVSIAKKQITYSGTLSDGWYYIKNIHAQKYLQVTGNSGGNGVNVEIATGTGVAGQKWYLTNTGDGYITLKNGQGYMLDVQYGTDADGTNIQTYSANGADAQKFKLQTTSTGGVYGITTKASSDARGLDVYNWNTADGTNVCQWSYYGSNNQIWRFEACSN